MYSALVFVLAVPGLAQPSSGEIVGTVRITGGNPTVGPTATVPNQETKVSLVVRGMVGGAYEAPDLPEGVYSVSAGLQGVRKVPLGDQRLDAGGALTVDLTLEPRVSEAVTMTAMKREETIK